MKRLFLLLIGAWLVCGLHAQVVKQNEPALVYYSPKTTVVLDFTYTVETFEPGIYAQYAEAMLGATDAVKENKKVHTLDKVQILTSTSADYNRPHKITAEGGIPMLLSINTKGLLTGYNVPAVQEQKENRKTGFNPDSDKARTIKNKVAPYPEQVLEAATPISQAHEVAKQIFHLRETRMYLLNGEVEHAPADGEAMKLVLAELDKQERELTELFMGKKTRKTHHEQIRLLPDVETEYYFFSEENGFTDAENIDADTIKVTLQAQRQTLLPPAVLGKKQKAPALSQIVFNLPGTCEVKVVYKGNELNKRTLSIAQFGVDVPLSLDLFTGATLPVIHFDERTGNIRSITK